jgi:uncharacterized membrane protein YheB (UPF0754 family)
MIKKGLPDDVIEIMQQLLDKPVSELTTYEKAFLRGRIDYLTKKEKEELGDALTRKFTESQTKSIIEQIKNKNET